jgi:hypothetical protein
MVTIDNVSLHLFCRSPLAPWRRRASPNKARVIRAMRGRRPFTVATSGPPSIGNGHHRDHHVSDLYG